MFSTLLMGSMVSLNLSFSKGLCLIYFSRVFSTMFSSYNSAIFLLFSFSPSYNSSILFLIASTWSTAFLFFSWFSFAL